jgi:uroporphyrinogen decarboxylase
MEKKYSSKDRVLATLNFQEPDRVPINYFANADIDRRLKVHFQLKAGDHQGLAQALGVDFHGIDVPYRGPRLHPDVPGRSVDIWGIHRRWIEHDSGGYWDYCDFPLKEANLEVVEKWPLPSPDDFDYSDVVECCRRNKNYALYVGHAGTGDIINSTGMIRSMEQVLVDLITDDPAGLRYIERKIAIQLEIVRRILEAAQGNIDFMWLGEDLGTQLAPMISLELFRKHIRPRHQKFVDLAKSFNLPVMIHTCGSSSWAYEDFIQMGINAVDTLQPEAVNMSPEYLKRAFGGRLAFHGCISTAGPVAYGTTDAVRENVKETLEIMMPGAGYCFAPTHALQDNSPTENVVTMYQAARDFGRY